MKGTTSALPPLQRLIVALSELNGKPSTAAEVGWYLCDTSHSRIHMHLKLAVQYKLATVQYDPRVAYYSITSDGILVANLLTDFPLLFRIGTLCELKNIATGEISLPWDDKKKDALRRVYRFLSSRKDGVTAEILANEANLFTSEVRHTLWVMAGRRYIVENKRMGNPYYALTSAGIEAFADGTAIQ